MNEKRNNYIFGGVGFIAGIMVGFLLGKSSSKKATAEAENTVEQRRDTETTDGHSLPEDPDVSISVSDIEQTLENLKVVDIDEDRQLDYFINGNISDELEDKFLGNQKKQYFISADDYSQFPGYSKIELDYHDGMFWGAGAMEPFSDTLIHDLLGNDVYSTIVYNATHLVGSNIYWVRNEKRSTDFEIFIDDPLMKAGE